MPNTADYALFAANAYATSSDVVTDVNVMPIPSGWVKLNTPQMSGNSGANPATGFLARAYKNTATNEIVIAYAGTTFEENMKTLDWTKGNIPGATGLALADQIVDAAKFYLDVVKANVGVNPPPTVSFTGHSLGGGLASLMAVYFDKDARTFDQAPFEASANSATVVNSLKHALGANYSLATLTPEFATYVPGTTNLAREYRVQLTYVEGEILRNFPGYIAALGGAVGGLAGAIALGGAALLTSSEIAASSPNIIDPQATGPSGTDLHDIRLLVALQQSTAFLNASKANPDFLQQVFQSPLYQNNTQNRATPNVLNLMIQQQVAGNQALDKLAEDIGKFKGTLDPVANNVAGADNKLKSALYQLAIALYYGEGEKRTGVTNTPFDNLIKAVTGGIQFAPDPTRTADYKDSLTTVLAELASYIGAMQDYQNLTLEPQRYTLHTTGAMAVTAAADGKADLMLGGNEADTLVASDGNDILIGRGGNDTLTGGSGEDTYLINSGDGADQIIDSGINHIRFNGKPVVGAFVKDLDGKFKDLDSGTDYTIAINSPAVLHLDAGTSLTFANDTSAEAFNAEGYGLRLVDTAAAIETTRTIVGDLLPIDLDPDHQHSDGQVHDWTDDLGNVNVTHVPAPGRGDTLYGSAGNDLIQGKGGDDWIDARGGADRIEGDAGRDILNGGDGKDLLLGGIEADLLHGGSGDDRLFADLEIQLGAVDSQPDGTGRELLAGGEGNDLAVGAATSDALFGGAGNDLLLGGAGDDDLLGDRDVAGNGRDWTLTREIISGAGIIQYKHSYGGDFTSSGEAAAGADILYGGAGNDWLFGGGGNDVLDGGALHLDAGIAAFAASAESRRWGDGECEANEGNDTYWRMTA